MYSPDSVYILKVQSTGEVENSTVINSCPPFNCEVHTQTHMLSLISELSHFCSPHLLFSTLFESEKSWWLCHHLHVHQPLLLLH